MLAAKTTQPNQPRAHPTQVVVDVDEEGTVAAAATAIVMLMSAGMGAPPKPYVLTFDRPFVFAVQHVGSGAVLVAGAVMQP